MEQAFGILVKKCCLLKRLEYSVGESTEIVALAMKLHNFCVDHDQTLHQAPMLSNVLVLGNGLMQSRNEWYVDGSGLVVQTASGQSIVPRRKRDRLVSTMTSLGYVRPPNRRIELPANLRLPKEHRQGCRCSGCSANHSFRELAHPFT